MNKRVTRIYFAIAVALLSACRQNIQKTLPVPAQHLVTVQRELLTMPKDSSSEVFNGLSHSIQVRRFYKECGDSLFWVSGNQLTEVGDSIIQLIGSARYYGLLPFNYHRVELEDLLTGKKLSTPQRVEALMTDAVFGLLKDIGWGRTSVSLPLGADSLLYSTIRQVAHGKAPISSLTRNQPPYPGYHSLMVAIASVLDTINETQREAYMRGSMPDSLTTTAILEVIEINLERWRLERTMEGGHYVLVNIPSNTLSVFRRDTSVLESRIITGKPEKPTPQLSSEIDCIILYPYWHVPRSIAVEEYLPAIRKDTTFLQRNRFDVLDRKGNLLDPRTLDWSSFNRNNFPVVIRQREGTDNSLGIIKFSFDNPYAVYLHDTNHKYLFSKSRRWFSHGCVRVERATDLAHYLLTGETDVQDASLTAGLKSSKRRSIAVVPAMAVHIRYFTCDVVASKLTRYEDIYRKDRAVADQLYRNNLESF